MSSKVDKYIEQLKYWKLTKPTTFTIRQEYTHDFFRTLDPLTVKEIRCREMASRFAEELYNRSETFTKEVKGVPYYRGTTVYETTVIVMSPDEFKEYENTAIRICIGDLVNLIYQDLKKEFEDKIGKKLTKIKTFYNQLLTDKD